MAKRIAVLMIVPLAILAAAPLQAQTYDTGRGDRRVARHRDDGRRQHHRGEYRNDRRPHNRRYGSAPTGMIDWQRDMRGTSDTMFRDWHASMCERHTRGGQWDSVAASHCPQAYGYGYRGENSSYGGWGRDHRNRRGPKIGLKINIRIGGGRTNDHPQPQIYPAPQPQPVSTVIFHNCARIRVYVGDPDIGNGFYLNPGEKGWALVSTPVYGNFSGNFSQARIVWEDGMALIAAPEGD